MGWVVVYNLMECMRVMRKGLRVLSEYWVWGIIGKEERMKD